MNMLEIRGLSVGYRVGYGTVTALDDVSFSVGVGEFVYVVGDNGSGKSTLIKSILNLVRPSSGQIRIGCGRDELSYIPQTGGILADFPATVEEVVLFGRQRSGKMFQFYVEKDKECAKRAMESVEIYKFRGRRIGELSGGQQQRVLLARALCGEPKFLLLDEPCAGLDEAMSLSFYELVESVNKELNTTILMVTHDLPMLSTVKPIKIVKLDKKIIFCGGSSEWLKYINSGKI